MRFLDLFAGIGGFRLGMEMAGHECVGYVEIDKFARQSYEAIHDTKGEWTAYDIATVTDEHIRELGRERGPIHVICGGFPCQSFSIAGKRGGFNDTRGTLFFEIMRFASILRPRYLFLENVEGLLNHDGGDTFEVILRTLDEVGYDAEWDVLNSKDFGVPQNRERVFIIGHLRGQCTRKVFPIATVSTETDCELVGLLDLPGKEQLNRVYSPEGLSPTLTTMQGGRQEPKIVIQKTHGATTTIKYNETGTLQAARLDKIPNVMMPTDIAKTVRSSGRSSFDGKHTHDVVAVLTPDREEKRQNGRRMKEPGEPMFTLTAQDKHGVYDGYRIRKLTPKECWRLQGFPDWAFDLAKYYKLEEADQIIKQQKHKGRNIPHNTRIERMSDSQLYKQAGNSVTVNVIYEIAKRLVE